MDTVRYIQETKRWLSRLVLQAQIHTLQSDLAHAYYLQGQYDVAIRILWEIQPPRSKRMNKMLYYNNLTCYYLAVGDLKSAAACFQDGEQTIEKTSKTSLFFVAPIILICSTPKRSCSTIKVRFKRAKSFFCRRSKGGANLTASCDLYLARIYLQTNRAEQAKILLDSVLMHPTFPCYVAQAKQLKQRWMAESQSR